MLVIVDFAVSSDNPTKFGRFIVVCPPLTVTIIVLPWATLVPATGFVLNTVPSASELSTVFSSYTKFNFVSCAFAFAFVWLTKSGTVTWAVELDDVALDEPLAIFIPTNAPAPTIAIAIIITPAIIVLFPLFCTFFIGFGSFIGFDSWIWETFFKSLSIPLLSLEFFSLCILLLFEFSLTKSSSTIGSITLVNPESSISTLSIIMVKSSLFLILSRASINSSAVWYLLDGSLLIAFIIKLLRLSGISDVKTFGSIGFSCICLTATVTGESPSKGTSPVTISYKTIPKE